MVDFRGNMRVIPARALALLGSIHQTPADVLAELIENGADAGASLIYVVVEKGLVHVIDNGHGMVPTIVLQDQEPIAQFLRDLEAGNAQDIRSHLSPATLASLQWMMEFATYSPKQPQPGDRTMGMKGVGALGFHQIGESAVIRTRPNRRLAEMFWESDRQLAQHPPLIELTPPSTAQLLSQMSTSYSVALQQGVALIDPFGRALPSGTSVTISGLFEGTEHGLRPSTLKTMFEERFRTHLEGGAWELIIVDRATADGRKVNGGITIPVRPKPQRGILVYEGKLRAGENGPKFTVGLYYDPTSKAGARPRLRRKGTEVCAITDLQELNQSPWNTGQLVGFIEYPDVKEAEWSTDKKTPLDSPLKRRWINALFELIPEIAGAISRSEKRARDSRMRELGRSVRDAALETIRDLGLFETPISTVDPPSGPTGGTTKPPTRVSAKVFNQHHRGVSGVLVHLIERRKKTTDATHRTGDYGFVSFGVVPEGRYLVRIEVPPGMTSIDRIEVHKETTALIPGFRTVFHLNDPSAEAPEPRDNVGNFGYSYLAWASGEPYRAFLAQGIIEINTDGRDFAQALDEGNEAAQTALLAQYTACALGTFQFEGSPDELAHRIALISGAIVNRVLQPKRTASRQRRD